LIDQLLSERSLLRDLPRESAPPDVLSGFQGQLERSVLLDNLDTHAMGTGRIERRGRWNLVVLLALFLITLGVSVIVWIAMPPQRGQQSIAPPSIPEPPATAPVDTTQSSVIAPATAPAIAPSTQPAPPPLARSRAELFDVADSNVIIVLITSADIQADQSRVETFLQNRQLQHPLQSREFSLTTRPATTAQQAWEVQGMSRAQAEELVEWFQNTPVTNAFDLSPTSKPATGPVIPATQAAATTVPTTHPAGEVMIIFENPDIPATQPVRGI
jgi:hypothetical protein